jgi:predicted choloylglycine hydrolase
MTAPWHSVEYPLTMYGIREAKPGPRWQALFQALWPAYRAWFVSEGEDARADLALSGAMLKEHMPELVQTWEQMVRLAGDDHLAARMLTMWQPPRFLPGCSQAVLVGRPPVLVRNYDYAPHLFEQVCYSSEFTGRRVIGTGDCLWGLLDGMNEDGLVVSLTFGGRPGAGVGFGIPLVVRYLLETAATVGQAQRILTRLPVSMAYNLTIADSDSAACTAFVAPGCPPDFTAAVAATNHHGSVPEHPDHARSFFSEERLRHLEGTLRDEPSADDLAAEFLRSPLYSVDYARSFGTLYTVAYKPADSTVEYRWPQASWRRTFASPDSTKKVVLRGT